MNLTAIRGFFTIIEKSEISNKLNKIKSAIPAGTTIPALQGVLLKNGQLTAYNESIPVVSPVKKQCCD